MRSTNHLDMFYFSSHNPKNFQTCKLFKLSIARFFMSITLQSESVSNSVTQTPWVFWDWFVAWVGNSNMDKTHSLYIKLQCNVQTKFTSTAYCTCKMAKAQGRFSKSDLSMRYVFFSIYSELNKNSIEIALCVNFYAKLLPYIGNFDWLGSLWFENFNGFLTVNKSAKVISKILIRYNGYYWIFGVLATPNQTIHIKLAF